mmetsp:Transcript_40592/g.61847  ORF Transcript_40592/g.61847 Transcript_40592/m.61847 type:complete len:128 (+) Transcript_40592:682-1065(+)
MIAFVVHRENDQKQQLLEKLGFIDNGKEKKLTFKYTAVNERQPIDVDHLDSTHCMNLQRSKYICIDDNLSKENFLGANTKKYLNKEEKQTHNVYREVAKEMEEQQEHLTEAQRKKKAITKEIEEHLE